MSKAKITLIDIETSPIIGYTWTKYDTNLIKIIEPTKIISMAWKDLGDDVTQVKALCDYKGYKAGLLNDKALMNDVWKVLDEADIVVAHNGQAFDTKKINARFIINGLDAPSSYDVVDTLKVAKKYFRFDSNSLDDLGLYLGEGTKVSTGGFRSLDCMYGRRLRRLETHEDVQHSRRRPPRADLSTTQAVHDRRPSGCQSYLR